jgi:hypothetical protein
MTSHLSSNTILENNSLFIRSQDADTLTEKRNKFNITLQNTIKKKDDELFKIMIQSVQIPYTFHNTNSTNNVIDWSENSVLKSPIGLKSGNYNILELISEIQNKLNENSSYGNTNYTINYNQIENIVELKSSNANNTKLLFNSGSNITKSIASQIGFTSDNDITFNSNTSKFSDSYVNLITINSLFIRSNISGVNTYDSKTKQQSNILSIVPINTDPLGVITYQYYEGVPYILYNNDNITNLEFDLTNENGDSINLGKNINWSFVLSIQIIKNPKHFRKTEINNNDLENELIEPKIIRNTIPEELIDITENKIKAEKLLSNNQKHNNNIDEILKNISKL